MAAEYRQDPTFFRTAGERLGRDGCRVPLPWTAHEESFGFSATGQSWLPQPAEFAALARDSQRQDSASTLSMYRSALRLRKELRLGSGSLTWHQGYDDGVVVFANGSVLVLMNLGWDAVALPQGELIAASETGAGADGRLHPNQTVWVRLN